MSQGSPATVLDVSESLCASFREARRHERPYVHFIVSNLLPEKVARDLNALPFVAPNLAGVSGKRELHNESRDYFNADKMARFPVMRVVAEALQSPDVVATVAARFNAKLDNTFLRLEYALDVNGFWLEPHTDLGVKKFTGLIYLSDGPGHARLGTDIYDAKGVRWGRSPFVSNMAMIFIPSDHTWHGFEKREINGVRRSMILNYVTEDWRAKEQLSFPETPIRLRTQSTARVS